MPSAPADYAALAPAGFEAVRTATTNLSIVQDVAKDLKQAGILIVAGQQATDPSQSPSALLASATHSIADASALCVSPLRELSAYGKLLSLLVPSAADAEKLAASLGTAAARLTPVDLAALNVKLDAAKTSITNASAPIATTVFKSNAIKKAMKTLVGKPAKPPATVLDNKSLFTAFADCIQPITGPLDINKSADVQTLLSTTDSNFNTATLGMTFADIIKKDTKQATDIQKAWTTFDSSLSTVNEKFFQLALAVKMLAHAIENVNSGITSVPLAIARFQRSIAAPPEDSEKLAEAVVKAWTIIGQNIDAFITFTTTDTPVAAMRVMALKAMALSVGEDSAPAEDSNPSPSEVKDTFGPPSYVETVLADLGPTSGRINAALSNFLQLPFIDALQIKNQQGADVIVRDAVIALKAKYQDLQGRSLPIIRDISTYGLYSEAILPKINQPGGLSLDSFIETNLMIVMRHGKKAKQIAKDTDKMKTEFADLLQLLHDSLADVEKSIIDLQANVDSLEDQYDSEKTTAIVQGVIGGVFLIAAIIAFFIPGGVSYSVGFGVTAATAFATMIQSAIEAKKLKDVLDRTRELLDAAKNTKAQLEIVIPPLQDVTDMMEKIGNAWDSISDNLADIEEAYAIWSNPKLFTPEYLQLTLDAWVSVRASVNVYVDVVVGSSTNSALKTTKALAVPVADTKPKALKAVFHAAVRVDEKDLLKATSPVAWSEEKPLHVQIMAADAVTEARSFFSAPTLRGKMLARRDLDTMITDWRQLAERLENASLSELSTKSGAMADSVEHLIKPSLTDAIESLLDFARKQPEVPQLPVTEEAWNAFYTSRLGVLSLARNKSDIVDQYLRTAQNSAIDLRDICTGKLVGLQNRIRALEAQEAEYRSQINIREAISSPFTHIALFGWGDFTKPFEDLGNAARRAAEDAANAARKAAEDAANAARKAAEDAAREAAKAAEQAAQELAKLYVLLKQTMSERQTVQGEIDACLQLQAKVEECVSKLGVMFETTAGVALFWADVTTQMSTADDLWVLLKELQEMEVDLYKVTWGVVVGAFDGW